MGPTRGPAVKTLTAILAALAVLAVLVAGPAATTVASAAPLDGPNVLADFEGGVPPQWFVFNGGGSTLSATTQVVAESDALARPGQSGDNEILVADFDVTDFGGFGQDVNLANGGPQNWSGTAGMSFWFYGTGSGLAYQAEIAENRSDPAVDTSERFDHTFTDDVAGWRLITIPWSDFTRATDFQPAGAPDDGLTRTEVWAWSIVLPIGTDTIYFDDIRLDNRVIDDFESGLPSGTSVPNGEPLGFYTFQGDGSVSIQTQSTPPAPALPEIGTPNGVMQMDVDVSSFAGYIHAFENAAVDTWVTQDWSTSEGIRFWMHGTGSGTQMFIDILDNRNPGSTTDDAERFSAPFVDDFTGWQLLEFPFPDFVRKEIGNGAPNDGLGLFEMHGYALGTLGTGGPKVYYFDNVSLYGVAEPPAPAVNFSQQNTFIEEGTTGQVGVKLNRPLGPDDPAQVSIDYATERSNAVPGQDFTPTSGTLTFVNGGPSELSFPVETFDDSKFTGDLQIVIRLTNPVDVERGSLFQGSVLIDDNDPFDPKLLDDFEQGAFLWDTEGPADIEAVRTEGSDADARPGQDQVENIGVASVPIAVDVKVEGNLCRFESTSGPGKGKGKGNRGGNGVVPVTIFTTVSFDATTVDGSTVTLGDASETHGKGHPEDVDGDGDRDLVLHFRKSEIGELDGICDGPAVPIHGFTFDGKAITSGGSDAALIRDFPIGQDWTGTETLDFWYYGAGGGEEITVGLKDNRAPDPGPSGWTLAWADEFDDPAGTPPNPANWAYEIGDTTPDGKNGWGNEELQYYTDDPANARTDGSGNLVITLDEADGSQECYYGPCEFESARLITQNKAEFAYGRIESRIQVPTGGDGLWPAFWSLGTDITSNPWPGAGEIDVMEYVSREPTEIFGTIHGPGYNGGNAFGDIYDFAPNRVDEQYHTFTVEWQPELIKWYVDGIQYHEAEPSDVPGPWVFEKPFFLLLNFAIGGNFGGAVDPANTYPQEYLVDYVRVYQGPDTAERFETTFTDSVAGWQQVSIPVSSFTRSADQPAGAPEDGLGLSEVWGYSLEFPNGTATGEARIDLVRRVPVPPPTELVVTNLDDSGPGSLREALSLIAEAGTITFDPGLAGGTLALTSGQLVADRSVTIDASAAPGIALSGNGSSRVFQIATSATVSMSDLVIRDGVAAPQGGGILNLGTLNLDRVVVTDNLENSTGTSFDFGGGGIYNGDGATLNLTDSTVSDNATVAQPAGGVYGFFNSTINITRSTISGNVGGDVAGGLRSLGTTTVENSTFSDNTSTAWHGGAMFLTDGNVTISNSTIVGNNSPAGTAGGLMVATFGAPVNVTIEDNIIADNGTYNCQLEGGGAAVLTSLGGNVNTDGSCSPIGTDQNVGPGGALVGDLADNGGPALTHALLGGSPAIDAAVGACPATDQRGVARPQGAGCDVGSFELTP